MSLGYQLLSALLNDLHKNIEGVVVETDGPDGVYDVGIEEAKMVTSTDNTQQFQWTLRINTGDYAGHKIIRYDSLYHSPESSKLCRSDLYTCGYPVENFNLLEDQSFCNQFGWNPSVDSAGIKGVV